MVPVLINKQNNTSCCLATTPTLERTLRAPMILEGTWVDRSWALGVSHTGYSSCDAKEHMFKKDIFTFHLNNLRISGSVSLAGETNRSLEKRSSLSKIKLKINATTFVYISVSSDLSHSVSQRSLCFRTMRWNERKRLLTSKSWQVHVVH